MILCRIGFRDLGFADAAHAAQKQRAFLGQPLGDLLQFRVPAQKVRPGPDHVVCQLQPASVPVDRVLLGQMSEPVNEFLDPVLDGRRGGVQPVARRQMILKLVRQFASVHFKGDDVLAPFRRCGDFPEYVTGSKRILSRDDHAHV